MSGSLGREALDFAAHAGSAVLVLTGAMFLGTEWTRPAAIAVAWALGFVREFTEWQDGGRHPFTRFGCLDQAGWITGGVVFAAVAP